ncbi:TPA: hypothetical protein ACH3X1_015861 [Trebouxia sp. C0004]
MRSKSSLVFSQPLVLEAFDKFKQVTPPAALLNRTTADHLTLLHADIVFRPQRSAVKMNCGGAHLASDASVGVKSIIYEAAMSINIPPEIQGTQQAVEIQESGTSRERCQAIVSQFPGQSISFYNISDGRPGWTDVAEDTIDALSAG